MPSRGPTTIAAIATPPGPGLRGAIRLSGPDARTLLHLTTRLDDNHPLTDRCARTGVLLDGRGHQPLLLLWMPGPHSYTREDVAELHLPGAPPLLHAALARLLELGAVLATPGEFTRRAFESGRIDLARAEGVLALVHASSEQERRSATALLLGGLGQRVAALRERLEDLRALAEASLDFDERDTGHVPAGELARMARGTLDALDAALAWEERREPLAGTPRIALAGAPNAGKSSLFNSLTGGRALVSDLPGTTRDGVAGLWRIAGADCRLLDAPGLERGATEADRLAQELARREREGVDLVLWVVDARRAPEAPGPLAPELAAERSELPVGARAVLVWSQVDRVPGFRLPEGAAAHLPQVAVSAQVGEGLEALERACAEALGLSAASAAAPAPDSLGRELSLRHRQALESARRDLQVALDLLETPGAPLDLVAEALRAATDSLDAIEGRTTPEDLLDRIFARFCLGK